MNTEHCLAQGLAAIHCTALETCQLRRVGAARRGDRLVAVLQPVALPRHDRRARRARGRRAHLPGRRLGAVGLEEPPRRAEGRRPVEPHAPQRRADGARRSARWRRCNPADAINWGDKIGRLKAGLHGDVLVTTDRLDDPYREPRQVASSATCSSSRSTASRSTAHQAHAGRGRQRAEPISLGRLRARSSSSTTTCPRPTWAGRRPGRHRRRRQGPPRALLRAREGARQPGPEKRPLWLMTDKPWDDPRSRQAVRSCLRSCASRRWTRSSTTRSTSTPSRPARCTAGCSTACATTTSKAARSSAR